VHSAVLFRIDHLGVGTFWGRFNEVSGTYTFDEQNHEACRFELALATESVDTNNQGRDRHLKSPDFFNAREFPTISFQSTELSHVSGDEYELKGDLTLHGVTKPITARVSWNGARDAGQRFGFRSGFEAIFTIKRSDFGMDTYVNEGVLGDEVRIVAAIEGVRE
jgi:polyisoprenoid-binding protein YceI